MKVETDAVLVVFWRWAEMVLRWHRPVGRSKYERRRPTTRKARRPIVGSLVGEQEQVDSWLKKSAVFVETPVFLSANVAVSIAVVTLRRAWLVLGWVTTTGRVNHLGM